MTTRKPDPNAPRLDREARTRIARALRAALPVETAPLTKEQADLVAELGRSRREPKA